MKVLIDSYHTVYQQVSGGVPMRISKMLEYLQSYEDVEVKCFNKWEDKISEFDVVHIFKTNIENLAEITYAKSIGKKIVISSVIPQDHSIKIKAGLFLHRIVPISNTYSFLRQSLCIADAIVAQTSQEAVFISSVYNIPISKIFVIPNGVNEKLLDIDINDGKKDIVLCVGRFDKNKNQLNLIKAMKHSDIPVHFVGGPSIQEPDYFEKCKLEARGEHNFYFHGWIKNSSEEFYNMYKKAKVVVLPSYKEIFGNSLIEGAACGANLVATSALPVHEWGFGDHCISVNVADPVIIRSAVEKVYNMKTDCAIREIVEEKFSWAKIVERYYDVYQSLLRS